MPHSTAWRCLTVCSPEWLAERCRSGELVSGLHHVVVGWDTYDERVLRGWLEARVHAVEAATWDGVVGQLRFLGGWESRITSPDRGKSGRTSGGAHFNAKLIA